MENIQQMVAIIRFSRVHIIIEFNMWYSFCIVKIEFIKKMFYNQLSKCSILTTFYFVFYLMCQRTEEFIRTPTSA